MSAVIVNFPRNARAISERLRAVRAAVALRATAVQATSEQRSKALRAAIAEMDRGGSAGWAIQLGYNELPKLETRLYRQPTDPRPAA